MCSDSNKRRGWRKGERKIEEKRQVCLCKQPQEGVPGGGGGEASSLFTVYSYFLL